MNIILAVLGSGVISTIISCVFQILNEKKSKRTQFEEGMSLLLLSSLKRDARDLISQGSIGKNDYDSFMATYNAYKALGGDGWADSVKEEVVTLRKNYKD